jgi:hypothetical protein
MSATEGSTVRWQSVVLWPGTVGPYLTSTCKDLNAIETGYIYVHLLQVHYQPSPSLHTVQFFPSALHC